MKLRFLFVPLAALTLFSIPAWADSVATIDVTASLISSSSYDGLILNYQSPTWFVTGQILFDMTTGIVTDLELVPSGSLQMNMSLLGPGGVTAQFSTQGTAGCYWFGAGADYGECFYHAQVGSASVSFVTIIFSPTFTVGQSWGACADRYTLYPGIGYEMGQGPCPGTSGVGIGDDGGRVYTLLDNSSSGRLTVTAINEVNVPEPNSLGLLTSGLLMTLGFAFRKPRQSADRA
jgi:hypothetical protein